jgi:hypothetical protein
MNENKVTLNGLNGTLRLISLSLFLQIVFACVVLWGVLSNGWENTVNNLKYRWEMYAEENPLNNYFYIGEILLPFLMGVVAIYLLYLLLTRNRRFPRLYVIFFTAVFAYTCVDAVHIYLEYIREGIGLDIAWDNYAWNAYYLNILIGIIWIPYVLKSKRVRSTFPN